MLVNVITCIIVVWILKRHLNTDQEQQTQQQQQIAERQQQLQTREQPTQDTRQLRSVDEPQNNDGELQHTELRDGTEWYEDEPWVVYFDHVMEKLGPDASTSYYNDGEFQVNPLGMFGSRKSVGPSMKRFFFKSSLSFTKGSDCFSRGVRTNIPIKTAACN